MNPIDLIAKQPFENVVRDYGETVFRVCRAVLGSQHDAEDAWSETFLAALRAYPKLPAEANVEAWLVTIAHRKAIDIIRIRARTSAGGTISIDEDLDRLQMDDVSGDAMPDAIDHDLWDAVRRLPLKQRQAVAYHHLGGLPYREIAELLGGTPDAARKAASDGIKTLRSMYLGDREAQPIHEDPPVPEDPRGVSCAPAT